MILSDYPIKTKEHDLLKRSPLAIRVADLIRNFEGEESFVIGVEGPWGSGKTSFINLILLELESYSEIIKVNFNPWNFTGQNELISDFFSSMLTAIKKGSNTNNDLAKTIQSYTSKLKVSFSPSIPIPFIGSINLGEVWRSKNKSLQEERDNIDNQLKTLNKKIIVVIDDIDRLDKNEIQLVMKLVKMTANFPKTIFLLAYERERIAKMLQDGGWSGEEYLKKIIQVSFTLPEPGKLGLQGILFNDLDDTIKAIYGEVNIEKNDEKHWHEILYSGFGDLFKTIRDIKRYISSLRLNWSIMGKDDVNMIDFMSIEVIRVFAPKFYSSISSNKSLFTDTGNLFVGLNSKDDEAAKETRYKELLQNIPKEIEKFIDGVCKQLFPQLNFKTHYPNDWQQEWRKERRICAEERFDFYFQLGIPEGAVSESEINNLLKTLNSKENFSVNILRFNEEKRLRQVLSKVQDRIEKLTEEQVKILISSLWDLEKQIDDERTSVFDFEDIDMQTVRLVYNSLKQVVKRERRTAFLEEIINDITTLYYPTKFIALLEDDIKKEADQIEEVLLTVEDINSLKSKLVKRINSYASDGRLSKEKNLPSILFRWKEWESQQKVYDFIEDLVKDHAGLLTLLCAFVSKVLSTGGNYKVLNKKSISQLFPIEKIEKLIAKIANTELEKMDKKEKEAINLFRNPPKNDW